MNYMYHMRSPTRVCNTEIPPYHSPADPINVPPPSYGWAVWVVVLALLAMGYARLHRPSRLRRGSIWFNPITGNATLYR